jgi:hypothetical protein
MTEMGDYVYLHIFPEATARSLPQNSIDFMQAVIVVLSGGSFRVLIA